MQRFPSRLPSTSTSQLEAKSARSYVIQPHSRQRDLARQAITSPLPTNSDVSPSSSSNSMPSPVPKSPVCVPEDFQLAPGEVSHVSNEHHNSDAFRCVGCTNPACQGPSGCASTSWRFSSDGYLREILTSRVYDVAVQTPLEEAKRLSESLGNTILLKREDLQPVFSFKLRGAYNKMAKLPRESLELGVITSSAGNHAQGVALAARRLGCRAIICMPVSTPEIKVNNVKRLGGIVELVGESYQETQSYAAQKAITDGLTFIAPYDDPYTIAGQGTIGDEILRQLTDSDSLDAIFVPIGGGGLIAGIAAYIKALKPQIKVYGVEPSGANAMAISLARGERVTLSRVDAFADGVAVKQVGVETFRMCQQLVDGVVIVNNSAISAAIRDIFNETRSILEPAGALALAGAKAWLEKHGHKDKRIVAVTSGANINFERLRLVAELANVGGATEATLETSIPEQPGAFLKFIKIACESSDQPINVTEFKYRFAASRQAHVLWGAGIKSPKQLQDLLERLNSAGMETTDLSGLEVAQVHLRHLVGGRAAGPNAAILHERIYQVNFPERPGSLARFLAVVSPQWNVTLFHYRNTGNIISSVLLGVQVPRAERKDFQAAIDSLDGDFTFNELDDRVRLLFDKFVQ